MHLLIYLQPFIEKSHVNLGMPLKSILEIITIIISSLFTRATHVFRGFSFLSLLIFNLFIQFFHIFTRAPHVFERFFHFLNGYTV